MPNDYTANCFKLLMVSTPEPMQELLAVILMLSEMPKEDRVCPPAFCIFSKNVADQQWLLFHSDPSAWRDCLNRLINNSSSLATPLLHDLKDILSSFSASYTSEMIPLDHVAPSLSTLVSAVSYQKSKDLLCEVTQRGSALLFWPEPTTFELVESNEKASWLRQLGIIDV